MSKYIKIVSAKEFSHHVSLYDLVDYDGHQWFVNEFMKNGSVKITRADRKVLDIFFNIPKHQRENVRSHMPKISDNDFFCTGCNTIRSKNGQVYGRLSRIAPLEFYCKACSKRLEVIPYMDMKEAHRLMKVRVFRKGASI